MKKTFERYTVCPENVSKEMQRSDFWCEKMTDPDDEWLSEDEIDAFNGSVISRAEAAGHTAYANKLENFPSKLEFDEVRAMINDSFPEYFMKTPLLNNEGEDVPSGIRGDIVDNATAILNQDMALKFGIVTRRTHLRVLPTDFISCDEFIDNDRLQLTSVSLGTPFAVLARSRDTSWLFVQTPGYRGWLKTSDSAVTESRHSVQNFYRSSDFLLATGSRVEIEPDPFELNSSGLFLQMGDKLPLEDPEESENLHAQGPFGCFTVKVPVRERLGSLGFRKGLVRMSEDVRIGNMTLTGREIVNQAFKMLGERYGWGGLFNRRDCSRFVQDIFASFGLVLPRDAWAQETLGSKDRVRFEGDLEERKVQLRSLKPGNPLYMPGHTLIYLGQDKGRFFAIHDGAGYKDSKGKKISVHGVFVMDLSVRTMNSDKSYLEQLTSALKIDKG
ncbi:MAG: SH3 domain-containing protein [Mesotoga sp.]|uniref:SH3 domain-containing protein n=1 Tax=Mesotoga sp. TaxID=2053577 RepID=UPI00260A7F60|nr:SH3 domain-containing protein [Mesotoga sp.]MDD3681112.1 SH3 domain-containing protein [Mesotoga sp.]MDD4207571.1 SH3 domain-containing protein [Mesotoga sp.]MDD5682140.1 SH3 domain-containing protein [Mesotoga sp.]